MSNPHQRYLLILAMLFGAWWVALAMHPWHRSDWMLENALAVAAVALLAVLQRRLFFSRLSYTLIFVFLCLHEVGVHYQVGRHAVRAWCDPDCPCPAGWPTAASVPGSEWHRRRRPRRSARSREKLPVRLSWSGVRGCCRAG